MYQQSNPYATFTPHQAPSTRRSAPRPYTRMLVPGRPFFSRTIVPATAVASFSVGIVAVAFFALIVSITVQNGELRRALVKTSLIGGALQILLWIPIIAVMAISIALQPL